MEEINIYIENKNYFVNRHGGLYLDGNLVTHEDIEDLAAETKLDIPTTHEYLVWTVKDNAIKEQKKSTAAELFKKVEDAIEIDSTDNLTVVADKIISTFDELRIYISANNRGNFVMPRKDEERTAFTYLGLPKEFAKLADTAFSGRDILNRVKQRLILS